MIPVTSSSLSVKCYPGLVCTGRVGGCSKWVLHNDSLHHTDNPPRISPGHLQVFMHISA